MSSETSPYAALKERPKTWLPSWFSGRRLHPFFSDVLLTGATQALILLANLCMVSLVSRWMGFVALGEYLLLKRVSSWLLTGTQLGLGVALPREIARNCEDMQARANRYFAAAFASVVPLLALVGAVAALMPGWISRLCFGSANAGLVYALALLLAGSGLQAVVFGYYRGLQRMRFANFVQIGGLVAVPLVALAAVRNSHSTPLLMEITGAGMAAVSIAWAVPILFEARGFASHFIPDARQLLGYGILRVPGDIASGALLTLGPVLAAHYAGMEQVSYLLLGVTCLGMTALAFWPVVMMLLAKVSNLLGAGRVDDVREYVRHLRSAVLQLSFLTMTQALIFAAPLVRWWLGSSYLPGVPVICLMMVAIPAYMHYCALCSILDAASPTPYNTRNMVLALAVFCLLSLGVVRFAPREWVVLGVAGAMTVSIYVLALATEISLRAVKLAGRAPELSSLWIVALMGAISLSAQLAFHFDIGKPAFCAVQLLNLGLAFFLTRRRKPEWVEFVSSIALSRA